MKTDTERLAWLAARVTYLEHKDKNDTRCIDSKEGGYWPQEEEDLSGHRIESMIGLSLLEYVDAMMEYES